MSQTNKILPVDQEESGVTEGINISFIGFRHFGANEVRAHARLRARADVVATKLGIILLSSFFLSSFLPRAFLPEGVYLGS